MAREGSYRPVGFGGAFIEQFRLLWMSRRPLLLLVGMLAVLALAGEPWNENQLARLFTAWPMWVVFVGPFWAFAVWYQEGPSNRLYFWSQPVSRTGHALARVAAGAAWLWALYTIVILAALLLATFDGDVAQFGEIAPYGWAGFYVAPLIGYLIISVLAVPSDYPIRWSLGILLGVPITLSLLDEWLGLEGFVRWLMTPLTDDRWGLGVSMVAPFLMEVGELQALLSGGGSGMVDSDVRFDPDLWLLVGPLWAVVWMGLIVLLATRHPDTFPRWRRSA